MSATLSSIITPSNHDRPLLHPSPLIDGSDQRNRSRRTMLTLLDLLTVEKMDGSDRPSIIRADDGGGGGGGGAASRWKFLRERLGCCGVAMWRFENDRNDIALLDTSSDVRPSYEINQETATPTHHEEEAPTSTSGVNLATALAAEREYRTTPLRVSLMRLLEETADGGGDIDKERKREKDEEDIEEGSDRVCCVCMGRKKGAALIPCGHTYCRVCSRELWLNRGSCPLCNQRILEILDIF